MNPNLVNALVIAYLGDAVFELYIREYLIKDLHILNTNELQKGSISYVSAVSQASFMKYALKNNLLTEEEISIYKRGRNTKGHGTKNKSTITHNQSSGFETLIGTLYLNNNTDRLEEIVEIYKNYVDLNKNK